MSSLPSSRERARRRFATSSNVLAASPLSAIPSRVLGHLVVVVLCLSVAYIGRARPFGSVPGSWSLQQATFRPSAFAIPDGAGPDTLIRPPVADTLGATPQRLQVMHYQTQPGDTVSGLAGRFDISENTIIWANRLSPGQPLTPGQQLVILPVSGVLYTAQNGDTVDSIARRFQSDATSIVQLNQLASSAAVTPGTQLVIPGGRLEDVQRPELSSRSRAYPTRDTSAAGSNPPPSIAPRTVSQASSGNGVDDLTRVPFKERTAAPASKPLAPLIYHVAAGDTLSSIAQRFGVSADSIAASNGLQGNEDSLAINQKLTIPPVPGVVHVVQDGDTLEGIAQRYSADVAAIVRANGLKDPSALQIGQTLIIPGAKVPAEPAAPTPAPAQTTYTVSEGDSVSSIANAFGVDMRAIIAANGLSDPYILQPGQQIVIPGASQSVTSVTKSSPAPTPAPAPPHTTYTVHVGDTLSAIADSFGIGMSAIIGANKLNDPSTLQPGQQLVIPGVDHAAPRSNPTPAPAPAPAPRPVARPAPAPAPRSSGGSGWSIVAVASRYLGAPYVWGGTSPRGFDCSGLVWYAYRQAGIPIPRDMWGQLQSGTRVLRSNLLPGDIVFFAGTYEAGLSHDGIYIGGGRFINAVDYGIGVAVSSLNDPYWSSHYFGATRPW